MSIAVISDIHVKDNNSFNYDLLLRFLESRQVLESESVFLLGDIFDMLIGNHEEYLFEFKQFFDCLESLIRRKIKINYFEGNHDFHVAELFQSFLKRRGLDPSYLKVRSSALSIVINDKKYFFAHGDKFDSRGILFKLYLGIVKSGLMKFVINNLVSYGFLVRTGRLMSSWSRKRGQKRVKSGLTPSILKDLYRQNIEKMNSDLKHDYIIFGHNHLQDNYVSKKGLRYISMGDPIKSNSFLLVRRNGDASFLNIK